MTTPPELSYDIPSYDIVVPTLGRPELIRLLGALETEAVPRPTRVVVVDDRAAPAAPVSMDELPAAMRSLVRLVSGGGRGPAAARNVGWRACSAEWVVFLDDDVVPGAGWGGRLVADLAGREPAVAGVQATIEVPLPADRPPTDWERNVAGLATAEWITADMAYRRRVLEMVGGFDERFPRAYREDSELAARVMATGMRLEKGKRVTSHPVRPGRPWDSVRRQAGNADDALMRVLHGSEWRTAVGAPPGRRPLHLLTTATALLALARLARRRSPGWPALGWLLLTLDFALRRLRGGPWSAEEIAAMLVTSAAIPPAASLHWMAGWIRAVRLSRRTPATAPPGEVLAGPIEAVLFDRDGTLVVDVPYNGDPLQVVPLPGAAEALAELRRRGVKLGVVTNQSGVARGILTTEQVAAVNGTVEQLLGPFDAVLVCPHGPAEGCGCRKPEPGLVRRAAAAMGVDVGRCVVVGDIGSDVEAARRAGAAHVLVPSPVTKAAEIASAGTLAADLAAVVDLLGPVLPEAA